MSSEQPSNNVRNINKSRKQALHALISSLSPADAQDSSKLSEEQVSKLSERLDQILGDPGDAGKERRNERGELLNEEGLPIIDITEPASESQNGRHTLNPFTIEQDPVPLSFLSEQDRWALRIKTNQIMDVLEAEEEQETARADALELQRQREAVAKRQEEARLEKERKLAAREMQKKMGKALLKNFAEQRQREEAEKAEEEAKVVEKKDTNGGGSKKPKKRVSFANVGHIKDDVEKPKPKPSLAWGDVSVGSLKGNINRVRLKASEVEKQPMKLDVVERVPGSGGLAPPKIRDSDDESTPDDQDEEQAADEEVPALEASAYIESDSDSTGSTGSGKDDDEEELGFSQAGLQREIALDYLRMRGSIGTDVHQAMSSHTFTGENEWDQPEVPLEATLASKPAKPNVSRFKLSRHPAAVSAGTTSISLDPSILPSGESHTLRRAVRTGKLNNGKLVGGEDGESASEDENNENRRRMLSLLKTGVPIFFENENNDPSQEHTDDVIRHTDMKTNNGKQETKLSDSAENATAQTLSAPKKSKFLSDRAKQSPSPTLRPGPSGDSPETPVPSSSRFPVGASRSSILRGVSERNPIASTSDIRPSTGIVVNSASSQFKKPPTVVSVPSTAPSQRVPRSSPQLTPDPAVLSTVVIDSPSFPRPSTSDSREPHSAPIEGEVRESVRASWISRDQQRPTDDKGGRFSRFRAERS